MARCSKCGEGHTPKCTMAVEPEVCVFCYYGKGTWEHTGSIITRAEDSIEWEKREAERDIVYRLRKRAEIRRSIPSRKSVQEGAKDRLAELLDEAAGEIEKLRASLSGPMSPTKRGPFAHE